MPKQKIEFIARGVMVHNQHILLCRAVKHNYTYLPGGHVEFGESAGQALCREFMEETGLAVRVADPCLFHETAFTQNGRERHELNIAFPVELSPHPPSPHPPSQPHPSPTLAVTQDTAPNPVPSLESDIAFDWVRIEDLPQANIKPESMLSWLMDQPWSSAVGPLWISEISDAEDNR